MLLAVHMSDLAASPTKDRRFTPGCLMFMVGGVWLLALGGWMIYSLFQQVKEIRAFADSAAKQVVPAQPTGEELSALRARLAAFSTAAASKTAASLRLSAGDLNALLATEEPLVGMKESALVEEITAEGIRLRISVGMNGLPLTGERFWLNGLADVSPSAQKEKGILLATKNLSVPGKTVSEGFIQHYQENGHLDTLLMAPYRTEGSAVLDILKTITTVRTEAGAVVVEFAP